MNKLLKILKKIDNPIKFGLLLAVTWLASAAMLYFLEIKFHGQHLIPTEEANGIYTVYSTRYDLFHDSFSWDKIRFTTMTLTGNADPEDLKGLGEQHRWCILEPTFNLLGFIKLLLIPTLYIFLSLLIIHFFIWDNRKYILSQIKQSIDKINPLNRFAIIMSCIGGYLGMYLLGFPSEFNLFVLGFVFICIPIAWFIFKKALAELVYAITKAFSDAKK